MGRMGAENPGSAVELGAVWTWSPEVGAGGLVWREARSLGCCLATIGGGDCWMETWRFGVRMGFAGCTLYDLGPSGRGFSGDFQDGSVCCVSGTWKCGMPAGVSVSRRPGRGAGMEEYRACSIDYIRR
jgi:hypothetical protein